jgi:hypothetical protein
MIWSLCRCLQSFLVMIGTAGSEETDGDRCNSRGGENPSHDDDSV